MFDRRGFLLGTGLALAAPSIIRQAHAAEPVTITFGPSTPVYSLSVIAIEKGFLREEGIDLKIIATDAGARARQNLAAGEAMFAHGDASHPLQLSNRGKRAKIVLCSEVVASYASHCVRQDLYDSGVTSIEALAEWKRPNGGKPVIGVTALGSGTWMYSTLLFQRRKLDRNVTWVASGGTSTSLAGLKSKQFDAITTPPSWQVEAERNGFGRAIYDVRAPGVWQRDFGGNIPVAALYALEETLADKQDVTQRLLNGLVKTMSWIRSVPTDEVYALVGPKHYAGLDQTAAKAELAFDVQTWPAYDGIVTREDFARGSEAWFRPGTDIAAIRYEDAVDMRFLEAARKKVG